MDEPNASSETKNRHIKEASGEGDAGLNSASEDVAGDSECATSATGDGEPAPRSAPDHESSLRDIGELTIADLVQHLFRAPADTSRAFLAAMNTNAPVAAPRSPTARPSIAFAGASGASSESWQFIGGTISWPTQLQYARLLLYTSAIFVALIGSHAVRGDDISRQGGDSLDAGASILWLAFLLWLAAELAARLPRLITKWRRLDRVGRAKWLARLIPVVIWIQALFILAEAMVAPQTTAVQIALTALLRFALGVIVWLATNIVFRVMSWRLANGSASESASSAKPPAEAALSIRSMLTAYPSAAISRRRYFLLAAASLSSVIVWINTSGNRIEPPIIALWLASAVLWAFVFAPLHWNAFDWLTDTVDACRRMNWRQHRRTALALLLILILGASFRFHRLDTVPAELFSDLVEKIQDAHKIHYQNDYRIFLSNIGGREPIHFYLLSMLASQPGMSFDHFALKLISALESFATIPLVFWLGVEVMGRRRRTLGKALGLVAAGLVAVSFWHVVIGRQGMRISLAPFFVALTAIFYLRALRYNRRADFVKAGLALGFGLYGYQAVRMLPVPIVAGVVVALLIRRFSWRARVNYLLHLAVLAFVSLMVFLPMLHFWLEYPEDYQRRTSTRIFGDLASSETDARDALLEGGALLLRNIRRVLLLFNYTSDSAWVTGAAGEPAMDATTAAFMALGVAAWLSLALQTRDPAIVAIPILVFFMLMASALALAFPIEVPSFARASGAIPPSYLMAALPICLYSRQLMRTMPRRSGAFAAVAFAGAVILAANHANTSLYFDTFAAQFKRSSHPYAQAGKIVRGFADSDGALGNAILLASPHWWDYRAVGIEAGRIFWDNGTAIEDLPEFLRRGLLRTDDLRLDPKRDLLFFYAHENKAAAQQLIEWFPQGRAQRIRAHEPSRDFYVYRVPALGSESMQAFLDEN